MENFNNTENTKKETDKKYTFLDGVIIVTLFSLWCILLFIAYISLLYTIISPIYYTFKYLILVFNNAKIDICIFVFDVIIKPVLTYGIGVVTAYATKYIRAYMNKKY